MITVMMMIYEDDNVLTLRLLTFVLIVAKTGHLQSLQRSGDYGDGDNDDDADVVVVVLTFGKELLVS